jgi:sugar O-acyltransferase (sialic acid O-acetyltransferase NeuD family)
VTERPLVILGAGTFAVEVLEAAELARQPVLGFLVSDQARRPALRHEGLPVWTVDDAPWTSGDVQLVGGIVSTRRRGLIEEMVARGFDFATVRHPSATVSPRARIAHGAMIGAGVIVSANTRLAPHVVLNRGANVAHDVALGAFATVGPGAVIAGAVVVGDRAWIGVGAVVRDHLTIGEGAVVGAGAVVVKDVAPHTLVAGWPAAVKREDVDGW